MPLSWRCLTISLHPSFKVAAPNPLFAPVIYMCPALHKALWHQSTPIYHFKNLIERSLSLNSVSFAKSVHAQLIKAGFSRHTFLGNCCLDLYTRVADVDDVFKVFEEISDKNTISWNICLKGLIQLGELSRSHDLFDEMPQRDVVSWNSMISGFASHGFVNCAMGCFTDMQNHGVRPSMYTFSTLMSFVSTPYHGKEIHGCAVRNGMLMSNVVIGNSLIDTYGRLGLFHCAFGVFWSMEDWDIISWNSLICSCQKTGCQELALEQFSLMRSLGYSPDGFTLSSVMNVCSDLFDLVQGKQVFACCIKMGLLTNSIVSSAAIDLFSKCDQLDDSAAVFADVSIWDSIVCNPMIASYMRHSFAEEALSLFISTLRKNIRPTEFTISSVLSCAADLLPHVPGLQVHSLGLRLGLCSHIVVASSLVDMYAKYGMFDSSLTIFLNTDERDLLCWNTMIAGLTQNGKLLESLDAFNEMLHRGIQPDHISFAGVLSACSSGGLVAEGINIFFAMEEKYGVVPRDEHYEYAAGLMSRAARLREAIDLVAKAPFVPSASTWMSILCNVQPNEDLELIEKVSQKVMEINPRAYLPYLVLSQAYEVRGRWESMIRVKRLMEDAGVRKPIGCSWVGVRNSGFAFESDELVQHGGLDVYLVLRLLTWDMQDEGYISRQCNCWVGAQ